MEKDVTTQTTTAAMRVTKDYVSRKDLMAMAVGQRIEFVIPDDKLESASSACEQMKRKRMKFSRSIKMTDNESSITIERLM